MYSTTLHAMGYESLMWN